jgi:hypothetical protein
VNLGEAIHKALENRARDLEREAYRNPPKWIPVDHINNRPDVWTVPLGPNAPELGAQGFKK